MSCLAKFAVLFAIFQSLSCQKVLKLTHVMYRHGDRTTLHTYPTDPYKDYPWPQGRGQLTQLGMRQQLALGRWLRERYIDSGFMNGSYVNDEIYVRSTFYDRTIQSAEVNLAGFYPPSDAQKFEPDINWQPVTVHSVPFEHDKIYVRSTDKDRAMQSALANLAGFYPPSGGQKFSPEINWQPVTVHTWPEVYDRILYMDAGCTKYTQLYVKGLSSETHAQIKKDNQAMLEYVSTNAGLFDLSFDPIYDMYDTLYCQQIHNLTLPEWVTDDAMSWLAEFKDTEILFWYFYPEMARLRGGPFVNQLSDNLLQKVEGTMAPSNRKMFMYAAHDSTLSGVMKAMDIFDGIMPPVASLLMWDLYETPSGHVVNIYYRNDTSVEPYQLTLPGCEFDCPVDQFLSLLAPMKFVGDEDDWTRACEVEQPDDKSIGGVIAIAVVGSLLVIIVVGLVIWCVKRNKKSPEYEPIKFSGDHSNDRTYS